MAFPAKEQVQPKSITGGDPSKREQSRHTAKLPGNPYTTSHGQYEETHLPENSRNSFTFDIFDEPRRQRSTNRGEPTTTIRHHDKAAGQAEFRTNLLRT
ncbi:hypothetical protein ACFOWZ_14965 [Lentzea rhizosphaerae]|uniref:Uncharacterized protein n=1 Tax=Lentzea rhizosphaerae TaxID=2041025 RepID=A0ABV8BR64_9PSEU